jgi:hypothetical protein
MLREMAESSEHDVERNEILTTIDIIETAIALDDRQLIAD